LNFGWGLHRKRFHKFAAVNAAKAATVSPNITITRNTAACPKRQRRITRASSDGGVEFIANLEGESGPAPLGVCREERNRA
jgi:hypothetical protein